MNPLAKPGIVLVPLLGLAAVIVPGWMKDNALTEEFTPALKRWDRFHALGEGKNGKLPWPKKVSDLEPSELPTLPGDVFVMVQSRAVIIQDRPDPRPAKIDDAFFALDKSLRAKNASSIRTVVYVKREKRSQVYRAIKGAGVNRVLTQIVYHLRIYDVSKEKKIHLGTWRLLGEPAPTILKGSHIPTLAPPQSIEDFLAGLPRGL